MRLERVPGCFAICRLPPDGEAEWAERGDLWSVTRNRAELSVVCEEQHVPAGIRCSTGWGCLRIEGPVDLSTVGVLASLANTLAGAGLSLFAISTFDTDYLLCRDIARAIEALRAAGHEVDGPLLRD